MEKKSKGSFKIYHPWYNRHQISKIDDGYFVFGDNVERKGSGPRSGQAVIRGLPNAIGVATKWKPTNEPDAFFSGVDGRAHEALHQDLKKVLNLLKEGYTVYWPANGIGTGRAKLPHQLLRVIDKFVEFVKEKYT